MIAELVLGVHLLSMHFPDHGQNNTNLGAYVRTESGWTAGVYNNSYRKTSVYAGRQFDVGPISLTVGGVTGYEMKVQPLVIPSYKIGPARLWLGINPGNKAAVGHISLEHEF